MPVPGHGNETSHFQAALAGLVEARGGLFQVVRYDAGALSESHASAVIAAGKDYLFTPKGDQRTMYRLAEEHLDPHDVAARKVDVLDDQTTETRTLTLLGVDPRWSYDRSKGPDESVWRHAGTFQRVEYSKRRGGEVVEQDARMFVSSRQRDWLTPAQWLLLVRSHWGVENNAHHTLDTAFAEDDRRGSRPTQTAGSPCWCCAASPTRCSRSTGP